MYVYMCLNMATEFSFLPSGISANTLAEKAESLLASLVVFLKVCARAAFGNKKKPELKAHFCDINVMHHLISFFNPFHAANYRVD